jgi:hypothetical protein
MNTKNNTNVANAVTELFTALQAEATATARVMDKFIKAYQTEAEGVCKYLNALKAKATGKTASEVYKDTYARKRKQVQNACKRPEIMAELFGDDADRTTLSIVQVKGKGFTWQVDTIEADVATEKCPEGTETEPTETVPKATIGKDLSMVNSEYLAEFGTTDTIEIEIEATIEMLQETLANLKAQKVA